MFHKNPTNLLSVKTRKISDEITETSKFMICVWVYCRLFGVLPMKLRKSRQNGQTVWFVSYSTAWAVYSWVIYILTVCMIIFGYLDIKRKSGNRGTELIAFHTTLVIATITVGYARCGTHVKCLIKAGKLVEKAQSIIIWSKRSKRDDKLYKILVIFLLCFWNIILIFGVAWHVVPHKKEKRGLPLYKWHFGWSYAVIYCMVVLFTTGIYSLKSTLSQINETLKQIKNDINPKSGTTGRCGDLRNKLSSVVEAHRLVGKAQCLLAKDQAPSLFILLLSIVARSVLSCTVLVFDSEKRLAFSIFFQVISCFCELFKLLCIVETCHWISTIANEIKKDASKLLTTIWDFGLRSDLKYCLRYLKDQSIEFTAMQVCKIDRSLIATVFGLILTNLIVVIQFT